MNMHTLFTISVIIVINESEQTKYKCSKIQRLLPFFALLLQDLWHY